jgi:hypothetical protein
MKLWNSGGKVLLFVGHRGPHGVASNFTCHTMGKEAPVPIEQ